MRPAQIVPALLFPLLLAGCGAAEDAPDSPSVAVTTTTVHQGSRPALVSAYGSAAPSAGGVQTISFAQPGQVTALLVMPGQAVRAGQVLLRFAPAASARASYSQARNAVQAATTARAATAVLLARQLATSDQMAQADRALADARASAAALADEGAAGSLHTVTAPFAGTVATLAVAAGDRTQPDVPLLTLARGGAMVVTAGIDPAAARDVAPGQAVTVQRLAGGAAVAGHVLRVGAALDPKTRLVNIDIAYPAGALLPGEAVRADIATHAVNGWLVPHAAVVTADGPPHLFQDKGGTAQAVPVTVLLSGDDQDVVTGAIDPARPVIVDGAYQVHANDRVRR
jgi:RND family efflux transporter MFP subunit